jgi:hypothetical protein
MKRHLLAATALALILATPAGAQVQTWQYWNANSTATTTLKSGPGVLHSVCTTTPVATGTIQLYDPGRLGEQDWPNHVVFRHAALLHLRCRILGWFDFDHGNGGAGCNRELSLDAARSLRPSGIYPQL